MKSQKQKKLERLKRKSRYGKSWDSIRELVYKRDGYKCRACGAVGVKLNAHHIILLRVSKSNDLRNLITLCDSCHKKIEENSLKILKNGGSRVDVVRATYKLLLEINSKAKNGKLIISSNT